MIKYSSNQHGFENTLKSKPISKDIISHWGGDNKTFAVWFAIGCLSHYNSIENRIYNIPTVADIATLLNCTRSWVYEIISKTDVITESCRFSNPEDILFFNATKKFKSVNIKTIASGINMLRYIIGLILLAADGKHLNAQRNFHAKRGAAFNPAKYSKGAICKSSKELKEYFNINDKRSFDKIAVKLFDAKIISTTEWGYMVTVEEFVKQEVTEEVTTLEDNKEITHEVAQVAIEVGTKVAIDTVRKLSEKAAAGEVTHFDDGTPVFTQSKPVEDTPVATTDKPATTADVINMFGYGKKVAKATPKKQSGMQRNKIGSGLDDLFIDVPTSPKVYDYDDEDGQPLLKRGFAGGR